MEVYIEVGANEGTDTQHLVKDGRIVYCFEPVHTLYQKLQETYLYDPRAIVLPFAVDVSNGFKTFGISGGGNKGCSSLHEFNQGINRIWPGRGEEFNFVEKYTVPTIRLQDFLSMYEIDTVDYLWIDAQGNDFNVLKSLGPRIESVKAGRCEAANAVSLYGGVDNSKDSIVEYLIANGFDYEIELDKSGFGAECDIIFKRKV